MERKILSINNIEVKFQVRQKFLTAIRNVSLDVYDQEILAIVGESGSGKSVITKTFTGMLEANGFISDGSIIYNPNPEVKSYFKEPVDLVDLQKNIIDKYTKKTFIKSFNKELKLTKKEIKRINKLNYESLEKIISSLKNKIQVLINKNNEFSSSNKLNFKITYLEKKLKEVNELKDLITNADEKSKYDLKKEELLFNIKLNKRKYKGLSFFNKYKIYSTKKFLQTFTEKYKNNKELNISEALFKKYKYDFISSIISKYKNKTFVEIQKLYIENNLNSFYSEIKNKLDSKDSLVQVNIELKKELINLFKNKKYKFINNKKIFSFLSYFATKEYNFDLEIKLEKIINGIFQKDIAWVNDFQEFLNNKSYKLFNIGIYQKFKSLKDIRNLRGKTIATIFQDPMTSLNPLLSVGFQITEVLRKKLKMSRKNAKKEAISLLEKVGIPNAKKRYKDIPGLYSGGMRQRVVIAIALAARPNILICDEPTTALDVTIQAQILDLIKDLQKEYKFTVIFITHDLGVVAKLADRVAVMYAGQIIEYGLTDEIFHDPKHPYTWALLSSLPQLGEKGKDLYSIKGSPPSLFKPIKGDAFSERSDYALEVDKKYEPPMFKVSETHFAKTWLLDKRAPSAKKPEVLNNLKSKIED
ncbi:oligopeptide ABC transporter ATP-binding protein [Spiroplasma litorale]|uniref:Oligopeptide ABC transporter ATP-binding protein n=1 Tax=Spiroplasma litorale TaxID=216942 RepID=A0A0K1W175_9MOLU|nr:oligopeptide/dipeptide ABC transporter ATP-binding protein [Spiroplasma litorale]AKX34075.1 oligopeptide ABC transporter ATP-binding protein [Spiroplasma litorale]